MAVKLQPEIEARVEQEKTFVTWQAKSRPQGPKSDQSRSVLMVLGILVATVLGFAGEWMLLSVLGAGAFFYYAWSRTPPEVVEFSITNRGIRAFGRLYQWWEFGRWWWEEKYGIKLATLELLTGMMGRMYLPVEGVGKEEVERVMNKYLLFEKPQDTTTYKMTRWMTEKFPLEKRI